MKVYYYFFSPASTILDLYIYNKKMRGFYSQIIIKIKTIKMKPIRMKKILMLSKYILPSVTSSTCTFLFSLIAEKECWREGEDGRYRERTHTRTAMSKRENT